MFKMHVFLFIGLVFLRSLSRNLTALATNLSVLHLSLASEH